MRTIDTGTVLDLPWPLDLCHGQLGVDHSESKKEITQQKPSNVEFTKAQGLSIRGHVEILPDRWIYAMVNLALTTLGVKRKSHSGKPQTTKSQRNKDHRSEGASRSFPTIGSIAWSSRR
jgi:hypothetical protein